MKRIVDYKKRNFNSWVEFIMCFGVTPIKDGGYLLFIYGWGGGMAMLMMWLILKYS